MPCPGFYNFKRRKGYQSKVRNYNRKIFEHLLNTISYAGAESTDIKGLISQSVEDNDKRIFLNDQIAIADDISSPDYSNSSNSPDVPVIQYLNAFNTYYGKSDTNSVYFSDIRTSPVKRGKQNIYINVYFTSFFKNGCCPTCPPHTSLQKG
ncbi:MAG: hypothetical protein WDM78_15990 [Puia sp.]